MATGGTIPYKTTQSVTFFNTAGLIEKHKNIYFVPRTSKISSLTQGTTVRDMYLSTFIENTEIYEGYIDMEISGWSPEDRSLTVKGNVDDFKTQTEEGHALNYFVVRRDVYSSETTFVSHYYAFFINGATQLGRGSVRLVYEPDHFTNVFYLHNLHELTTADILGDYEPFNKKMKNCYVERQHYNRTIFNGVGYEYYNLDKLLNTEEKFAFRYQYRKSIEPISFTGSRCNLTKQEISTINSTPVFNDLPSELKTRIMIMCTYFVEVKMNAKVYGALVYSKQTSQNPASINLDFREESSGITSMYQTLYFPLFIVRNIFKKYETDIKSYGFQEYLKTYYWTGTTYQLRPGYLLMNIDKTGDSLLFPNGYHLLDYNQFLQWITSMGYGQYIISQTILPLSKLSQEIEVDNLTKKVRIKCYTVESTTTLSSTVLPELVKTIYPDRLLRKGLFIVGITTLNNNNNLTVMFTRNTTNLSIQTTVYGTDGTSKTPHGFALILSGDKSAVETILLPEKDLSSSLLKDEYFEPTIEQEPYNFYSLSYVGSIEVPLKRNRYYQTNQFNLKAITTNNDALKMGLLPVYTVDGSETTYYNEGIVLTLPSTLPIVSDAYMNYYYNNKAQMRNQYAVTAVSALTGGITRQSSNAQQSHLLGSPELLPTTTSYSALNSAVSLAGSELTTYLTQKAVLSDLGNKPDTIKQSGSDVFYDLDSGDFGFSLNRYEIDRTSYISIAKYLERFGYLVNLYDTMNTVDRVGWNFIKLISFDYEAKITIPQEEAIKQIFSQGVTLLHNPEVLTSGHNYETILE